MNEIVEIWWPSKFNAFGIRPINWTPTMFSVSDTNRVEYVDNWSLQSVRIICPNHYFYFNSWNIHMYHKQEKINLFPCIFSNCVIISSWLLHCLLAKCKIRYFGFPTRLSKIYKIKNNLIKPAVLLPVGLNQHITGKQIGQKSVNPFAAKIPYIGSHISKLFRPWLHI